MTPEHESSMYPIMELTLSARVLAQLEDLAEPERMYWTMKFQHTQLMLHIENIAKAVSAIRRSYGIGPDFNEYQDCIPEIAGMVRYSTTDSGGDLVEFMFPERYLYRQEWRDEEIAACKRIRALWPVELVRSIARHAASEVYEKARREAGTVIPAEISDAYRCALETADNAYYDAVAAYDLGVVNSAKTTDASGTVRSMDASTDCEEHCNA